MTQWYLGVHKQKVGPLEAQDLLTRFKEGSISADTLVWRQGYESWRPFSKSELFLNLIEQQPTGVDCSFVIESSEKQGSDGGLPPEAYAGFWVRFVPYWIDQVFLVFLVALYTFGVSFVLSKLHYPNSGIEIAVLRVNFLITTVLTYFYFTIIQALFSGTLGKRLLGLRLVDLNANPISFGAAIRRYFYQVLGMIPLGIGFFSIAWNSKKRGWHDHLSGSMVIKKRYLKKPALQANPNLEPEVRLRKSA